MSGGRLPLIVHTPSRMTFDVSQAGPGIVYYTFKFTFYLVS